MHICHETTEKLNKMYTHHFPALLYLLNLLCSFLPKWKFLSQVFHIVMNE